MTYSKLAISGKERKLLLREATDIIEDPSPLLPKKGVLLRYYENKKESGIVLDRKNLVFVVIKGQLIPSIKLARKLDLKTPTIVVDLGAIKFVTNGADIMRPGITEIDQNVLEGQLVLIVEERNKSPLAFGRALFDAVDMKEKTSGKCIKNLHWLKDKWFEFDPSQN